MSPQLPKEKAPAVVQQLHRLPVAILASLAVHLLLIGTAFLFSGETVAAPLKKVIVAELVVRAPKQKPKALPRRVRTTKRKRRRPAKKKPLVTKSDLSLAAKALERTRKEVELDQAQDLASEALARVSTQEQTGDAPDEARGNPDGSDQGSLSDGQIQEQAQGYLADCARAIKQHPAYAVPDTLTPAQRVSLKVELFFRIGPDGRALEVKLVTPSGHAIFDRDMLAVARVIRFPKPPDELIARMAKGVTAVLRP